MIWHLAVGSLLTLHLIFLPTKVEIRFVILDELTPRPVALTDFVIFGAGETQVKLRSDVEGKIRTELEPGEYEVRSEKPTTFKGKDYVWQKKFTVQDSGPFALTLTQEDAQVRQVAATRHVSDEARLYQVSRKSVCTVDTDSGKGSGFVVDAARGLILTNSHGKRRNEASFTNETDAIKKGYCDQRSRRVSIKDHGREHDPLSPAPIEITQGEYDDVLTLFADHEWVQRATCKGKPLRVKRTNPARHKRASVCVRATRQV
ncbi:MAG: hypothetical protein H0W86_10190 [Armatimonadetes bacterium]|nr:hypothetical protein [Armatimonadota bacterium]